MLYHAFVVRRGKVYAVEADDASWSVLSSFPGNASCVGSSMIVTLSASVLRPCVFFPTTVVVPPLPALTHPATTISAANHTSPQVL